MKMKKYMKIKIIIMNYQHQNKIYPVKSPPLGSRFVGKVAIITESNCWIDRATAILMGKEGAKVTIHGTVEKELKETIVKMVRTGIDQDNILVVQGAIENDQTLKNLVDKTYNKFGRIDILVNSAGAIGRQAQRSNSPASAISNKQKHIINRQNSGNVDSDREENDLIEDDGKPGLGFRNSLASRRRSSHFDSHFDTLFNINLKSITKLTRLCVPYLEKVKGAVVNVSSFGGQQAFSDYAYYNTSRVALDNYCRSIAIKYAQKNVRVNNVRQVKNFFFLNLNVYSPGFITSESIDEESTVNKFYLNWIKEHAPMARGGTAEEIAKVIAFLASDDASYVTGSTIVADGGVSIFSKPADFF
ncbi:hypothetical protein Mgra_00007975 [Meloidogyne graminicola]|uniref:Uncharacterized protein n=1 Tax=Meloidogyne graminicola TaxID=189291 RepID=A0A8S9ZH01_9BILA|nr:hypothetical protein Mgra_00007975 [Meloidogyne graminicola]